MTRPTPLSALAVAAAMLLAACGPPASSPRPAAEGSDAPTSTSAPTTAAVDRLATPDRIPDDFPLTSGWAAGLESPRRADADLPPCVDTDSGEPPDPTAADRLLAAWGERRRTRQLTLYRDAASARAAVRDLIGYYRRCAPATVRTVRDDPGPGTRWEVLQTGAGRDGALGGSVLQVVQVRRSVLLDVAGGLADGPHWARRARSIAADQVTWSARVVSAMGDL